MRLNIAVVGFDGVDNGFGFLVLSCDVDTDGDVAALDLVVDGLADIVQQPSSAAIRPARWETSMEWLSTFWP